MHALIKYCKVLSKESEVKESTKGGNKHHKTRGCSRGAAEPSCCVCWNIKMCGI